MGARTAVRAPARQLPDTIRTLLQETRWLALGAVALFLSLALWGYHRDDPGWSHAVTSGTVQNPTGHGGAWIADLLLYLFGLSAWWLIVLLGMFVWRGFHKLTAPHDGDHRPLTIALAGFVLLLVASAALEALRFHSLKAGLPLAAPSPIGAAAGRPGCCGGSCGG